MKTCRLILFLALFLAFGISASFAAVTPENILYAKEHLIILVHGLGDDHDCFKNVKNYLDKTLGLEGYVYAYEFSNKFLKIEKEGREFGDRAYDNPEAVTKDSQDGNVRNPWEITKRANNGLGGTGKSWLEQAKEDFKIHVVNLNPNDYYKNISDVPDSMVPQKFIVIAHSMGGLAVRSYILGKDQNGQRYYQNDIVKLITIDTPHAGSGSAAFAKNFDNTFTQSWTISAGCIGLSIGAGIVGNKRASEFFAGLFAYSIFSSDVTGAFLTIMDRHKSPALEDMVPGSQFLANLNSADFGSYDPIKYRLIAGRGVPSPQNVDETGSLIFKHSPLNLASVILANLVGVGGSKLDTPEGRITGALLSMLVAYPMFGDGDMGVEAYSQLGEGVSNITNPKTFAHTFRSMGLMMLEGSSGFYAVGSLFDLMPEPTATMCKIVMAVSFVATIIGDDNVFNYLSAHTGMKDKIVIQNSARVSMEAEMVGGVNLGGLPKQRLIFDGPTLLEEALFDNPDAGGATAKAVKSQALILSTNLTKEADGKLTALSAYHPVEVRGYSYAAAGDPTSLPIVVDGKENRINSITVTEAPTKVEGVLRDFMPKKMQYFQYSENFAAWKDINIVDEWGRFVVDGLKFAEGQNVLAFRGKNKVGYESHQILKVILNTIPMVASEFSPIPGTFINNNRPTFRGKFAKASYSADPLENIEITSAKLLIGTLEVDVTDQIKKTIGGEAYNKFARFELTSDQPLPDGHYTLVVVANSNVGVSQAVMDVVIDTQAPTLAIQPLQPYSPRAPATIRYTSSDEASPNLRSIECKLYDSNNTLITTIATADALSKGDNFFAWDGSLNNKSEILNPKQIQNSNDQNSKIADGSYKIKIKAFDLAGNQATAEQPIIIDSTPPAVAGADVSPNPMTSKTSELGLTARVSEKSTVIIKLNNLSNNTTTAYLAQANNGLASYTWKYDQMFSQGPEDGSYRIEVVARDEAGNESAPRTLEAVRIDRTPPVIYGQMANPYVLANSGTGAYKTNLSYNLTDAASVKIKIYNSNTGLLASAMPAPPASNTAENQISWDGSDPKFPKGAYRFQIIAEDDVGNVGVAYASCVKDGIAPVISYPVEDGAEVSGTISIRGTAIDPDWTNDKPFKQYRVYYQKAGEDWKTDAVEVPLLNRGNSATPKNTSLRPLQNDSTLAYLYTNQLANGEYTVKVAVDEDGGESLITTRTINVNNNAIAAASAQSQTPYVKLKSLPNEANFKEDDSVKLPLGFINSVKPANVYVEVVKASGSRPSPSVDEVGEVVFFKYFPNILGAPFIGKPEYKPGTDLGYFIWSDDDGYHLRWSADGSNHKFTGSIVAIGGTFDSPSGGQGVRVSNNIISWDASLSGGEGGVDFKLASGQIMITAKLDEDPEQPEIYASSVYLGVSKFTQPYLPIIIDAAGQRLVDVTSMGKPAEPANLERSTQTIEWNGKLDSGAYVDNGNYIVRVRAEGADGVGVATDEAIVSLKTPFKFSVKEVTPANKEFSTLGGIDRVSVFYNVSKDSIVSAYVYEGGDLKCQLLAGKEVLGMPNPNNPLSLVWRGNFPDPDSTQVVTGGNYKIILNVTAKDGSESKSETIDGIRVATFSKNDALKLEPIGSEADFDAGYGVNKIRLAAGDSPYYLEIKGSGRYHPPKDFTYTLTAAGKQKITAYPFVPFAGLMHRGFREVNTKAKVRVKVHGWDHVYKTYIFRNWNEPVWMGWERYDDVWDEERIIENISFKLGQNLVSGIESFSLPPIEIDTASRHHQEFGDRLLNKPVPGSGIDSVELIYLDVYSKNGDITLDQLPSGTIVAPGSSQVLSKGVFKATNIGEPYTSYSRTLIAANDWPTYSYGAYRVKLNVALEAPIAYSRLTNRFVPWVGFINAKQGTVSKDFSEYLIDINRGLGFPGKAFFDNPAAKPDVPYKPKDQIAAELKGLKWEDQARKMAELSNQANLLGYTDALASGSGYDSYLSDGYFEFIPITSPDGGAFDHGNSSAVKVNTKLVYASDGNPPSPFEFSWPWNEGEYTTVKEQQKVKRAALDPILGGNPQNYTGYTLSGTWWELDENQIAERKASQNNTRSGSGQVRFDKNSGKSVWSAADSFGEFLPIPNYVDGRYAAVGNTAGIKISPASGGKNDRLRAEDADTQGLAWTTADDVTLLGTGGLIKGNALTFNEANFLGRRELKIADYYNVSADYQSAPALKYTFLKYNPFAGGGDSPIDNPNVVISEWQAAVKDKTGGESKDIKLEKVALNDKRLNDTLTLKLKLDASEARYVEVLGSAPDAYELMYFDGKTWKTIGSSPTGKTGRLGWWNVSRLNGKHTLLLKSGSFIAAQEVQIGTLVAKAGGDAYSTYKRAQLKFPAGAFVNGSKLPQDQLVTITPVTMKEIFVRNRPIILTSGPIVEIKPSPWKFALDQRPTLRFIYTFDDLADPKLGLWDTGKPLPAPGTNLGFPLNIHQVTDAGDLQLVSGNNQTVEINNGEHQYVFYAALDHFSTYTLINGKFKLSAPMVFADRYITNKETVTIYGTAEPESVVTLYVKDKNIMPEVEKGEPYADRQTADGKGNFRFENVKLLQEGNNYLFVTSHQGDNREVRTYSDLTIVKDTVPPILEAKANSFAFSPNGDGKFDEIAYRLRSTEKGRINFMLTDSDNKNLYSAEIPAGESEEIKLVWTKEGFNLSRRNNATGNWLLAANYPLNEQTRDGLFRASVFAFDEAGNISQNQIDQLVLDTTPPVAVASSSLKKFSPDGNGKFDSTQYAVSSNEKGRIYYELKKPDSALLFKDGIGNEADKKIKFTWDHQKFSIINSQLTIIDIPYYAGRLADGVYTFEVVAVDEVENRSPPVSAEVMVDLTPPGLLTFSATPEYFSPNNDGVKDTTAINYSLNEAANVSFEVTGGYLRLQEVTEGYKTEGSWLWPGSIPLPLGEGGGLEGERVRAVEDARYRVNLFAEDEVGNSYSSAYYDKGIFVTVDTLPPVCTVVPNLFAVSPNGDGKFDSVAYEMRSNEIGDAKLSISASSPLPLGEGSGVRADVLLFTGAIDENKVIKSTWGEVAPDGQYEYSGSSTDRAGNRSKPATGPIVVDNTPPQILSFDAAPNPFTPNDDGIKDTAAISYQFSEPVNAVTKIFRDDGKLFRSYEEATENFIYPTTLPPFNLSTYQPSVGGWAWDGRGSRNEMLGGAYTAEVYAEDWVGNPATSEAKTIVVDRAPTLIPYAYAVPDPFAPVNPNNSFTEIKYYLARDNLKVRVAIIGEGSREIKALVRDEIKSRGEHAARWLGDDEAGKRLTDGSYEFRVTAEDPNEPGAKSARVSNTVLVDNVPPYIALRPVQIDFAAKKAVLAYNLPESSSVEVGVYDNQNNLIATLVTTEAQAPGNYTVAYDWQILAGDSAQRYFKIAAIDRAKNSAEINTEVFAIVPNLFEIANARAVPSTFTPNGDGHSDLTRIAYKIAGGLPPYAVSITILNPTGSTVKKIIENETQSAADYSFYWDGSPLPLGEGSGVRAIPDGYYDFVITAEDKLGSKVESRGSLLAVSTRPAIDLTTNLPAFSPNGDGAKDKVTFNYSINYPTFYISGEALVKIEVLNTTGEAVWSKVFNKTAGSFAYEYDGSLMPGNLGTLKPGQYYVKISADDALGTTAVPKTVNLKVDYDLPRLAVLSLSPNPFSPNGDSINDQAVLSYSLSKPAYVSIDVVDSQNNRVRNLIANQYTDAYTPLQAQSVRAFAVPTIVWDGYLRPSPRSGEGGPSAKPMVDEVSPDGLYTLTLTATDESGNTGAASSEIRVDNAKPATPEVALLPAHTNRQSHTIAGTAEPFSLIKGTVSGSADAEGKFSIPTTLVAGANVVKLTATDAAGNVSAFSATQEVVFETAAPVISSVSVSPNPVKAGPLTITFNVSETLESDPVVKVNGNPASKSAYSILPTAYSYEYRYIVTGRDQQGPAVVSIEATDLAGNLSTLQPINLLSIDTINPTISNLSASPNPAKAGTITIAFNLSETLESNPIVRINTETATLVLRSPQDGGGFRYEYTYNVTPSAPQGPAVVSIEATDPAYNLRLITYNFMIDTIAPSTPVVDELPRHTNVYRQRISGSAEADSKVFLFNNDNLIAQTQAVSAGRFSFDLDMELGANSVHLYSEDAAGNTSEASERQTVIFDTQNPVFSGISVSPNPAKAGPAVITFVSSKILAANPIVKVNQETAAFSRRFPPPNDLNYEYTYNVTTADAQGKAQIEINGVDLAGNPGQRTSDILVIDTINPSVSGVSASPNPAKAGPIALSFTVSETLESNPIVKINSETVPIGSGFSRRFPNLSGWGFEYSYNVTTAAPQGSAIISIEATDLAGNLSTLQPFNLLSIDLDAPQITAQSISQGVISSDSRARIKSTAISYRLSDLSGTAAWELNIVDSNNQPVWQATGAGNTIEANWSAPPLPLGEGLGVRAINSGLYYYSIRATDRAGNVLTSSLSTLEVDNDPPVISFDAPAASVWLKGGSNDLYLTVADAHPGAYEVRDWNNRVIANNARTAIMDTRNLEGENYRVTISAEDAVGLRSSLSRIFKIDSTAPAVSNIDIDAIGNPRGGSSTVYAKLGAEVRADFSVDEPYLSGTPEVLIGSKSAALRQAPTVYSPDRTDYSYSYIIQNDDADGATPVTFRLTDQAGNVTTRQIDSLIVDKDNPTLTVASITPDPAKAGEATIAFTASENLKELPAVAVTQQGAGAANAIVSALGSNRYEVKYQVFAGNDGPAALSISARDLALNSTSTAAAFTVDTTPPTFTNLRSEIGSNPEFTKFAKEGSAVAIAFQSSERLQFNPVVRVNSETAAFSRRVPNLSGEDYEYTYTVSSSDTNGTAEVVISGSDPAGNEGSYIAASPAESFVIDLQNPTVAIAAPETDLISTPGNFSTNANPDGSDRPRSTTFHYSLAEPSKVTVKVHKVPDSQTTYTRADFNSGNLIKTLVDDVWQSGSQTVDWEGRNQAGGWSVPGKYAFIVEGRDRAGNLTLKKWGGTVWIQDNVLTLREPEQRDFSESNIIPTPEANPDPHYISPGGNSTDEAQRRARFYFMIGLTLNPAEVARPERIEAMAVEALIKKVGTYSVKVYSDSALTNLVRTIASNADAWSGTLTHEDWNGRDNAGQFAADGTYYLAVDVRDYRGNSAGQNMLTRAVVVDSTPPTLAGQSVSNPFFSPGTSSEKNSTAISYTLSDSPVESSRVTAAIEIFKDGVLKAALQSPTTLETSTAGIIFTKLWQTEGIDGPGTGDGTYTYRITAVDQAGNFTVASGEAVVDRVNPTGTIEARRADGTVSEYTNSAAVSLNLSAADNYLDDMQFSGDGSSWSSWENYAVSKAWGLTSGDALKTVYVRYRDRAGNWIETSDTMTLDTTAPSEPIISASDTAWSNSSSFSINWTNPEQGTASPIAGCYYQIASGAVSYTTSKPFNVTATAQGGQALKFWLKDSAENSASANFSQVNLRFDNTPPPAPAGIRLTPAPIAGGWINVNAGEVYWDGADDAATGGANPCTYIVTLDDADVNHAAPRTSGWRLTGLAEGLHTVRAWAVDAATNRSTTPAELAFKVDTKDPTWSNVTCTESGGAVSDTWQKTISDPNFTWGGASDDNLDGYSIYWGTDPNGEPGTSGKEVDSASYDPSAVSNPSKNYLRVRAYDKVGRYSDIITLFTFKHDAKSPVIDITSATPSNNTFNPYVDGSIRVDFTATDEAPSSGFSTANITAKIKAGTIDIKTLTVSPDSGINYHVIWNGTNNSNDYVNEGDYTLEIAAADALGNSATTKTSTISLRDDQRITTNTTDSINAYLSPSFSLNIIDIWWIEEPSDDSSKVEVRAVTEGGWSDSGGVYDDGRHHFSINRSQQVQVESYASGGYRDRHYIMDYQPGSTTFFEYTGGGNTNRVDYINLEPGNYNAFVYVNAIRENAASFNGYTKVTLIDYKYKQYRRRSYNLGKNWEDKTGPSLNDNYLTGPTTLVNHSVWSSNNQIYYKYDSSSNIKITNSSGIARNPSIAVDSSNNAYIAWQDSRDGNNEIYFQKIPSNFAPVGSDASRAQTLAVRKDVTALQATIEAPVLIAPADKKENVQSIRPTFEWKHKKSNQSPVTSYQLDVAKNDRFSIAKQSFTKSANAGSADKADSTLYFYNYSIHEFDPGLDKDTYYWKVTALATNEAATSEVWSFTIKPELSLSGITNYPNPFNPNKEKTKIRYRLSTDASEVKIRIYDIAGSLVTELDGALVGEGSSIWNKYNDVEWGGTNGRGEKVMNGIYPFEITAKLGDRIVSGRGKIAVLK